MGRTIAEIREASEAQVEEFKGRIADVARSFYDEGTAQVLIDEALARMTTIHVRHTVTNRHSPAEAERLLLAERQIYERAENGARQAFAEVTGRG